MEDWKKLPDSEGDWLWVEMWSCGCCVMKSGIAWVANPDEIEATCWEVNGFKVSWECHSSKMPDLNDDGSPVEITGWKKVNLPPQEWTDEAISRELDLYNKRKS